MTQIKASKRVEKSRQGDWPAELPHTTQKVSPHFDVPLRIMKPHSLQRRLFSRILRVISSSISPRQITAFLLSETTVYFCLCHLFVCLFCIIVVGLDMFIMKERRGVEKMPILRDLNNENNWNVLYSNSKWKVYSSSHVFSFKEE